MASPATRWVRTSSAATPSKPNASAASSPCHNPETPVTLLLPGTRLTLRAALARGRPRAPARVSIRDRPDHPLVGFLVWHEPRHARAADRRRQPAGRVTDGL